MRALNFAISSASSASAAARIASRCSLISLSWAALSPLALSTRLLRLLSSICRVRRPDSLSESCSEVTFRACQPACTIPLFAMSWRSALVSYSLIFWRTCAIISSPPPFSVSSRLISMLSVSVYSTCSSASCSICRTRASVASCRALDSEANLRSPGVSALDCSSKRSSSSIASSFFDRRRV